MVSAYTAAKFSSVYDHSCIPHPSARLPSDGFQHLHRPLDAVRSFPKIQTNAYSPMNNPGELKAMISATARDLTQHRLVAQDACIANDVFPVWMKHLPAQDSDGFKVSMEMVDKADIYIGIYAWRYGWVPDFNNPNQVSITELEFEHAVERKASGQLKEILIFISNSTKVCLDTEYEKSDMAQEKLKAFKERASHKRVVGFFNSPEDLQRQISEALASLKLRHHASPTTPPVAAQPALTPQPPAFYAAKGDYIGSHKFVGRAKQLQELTAWAQPSDPETILLFEAIGGNGKSMLTWHWVTNLATTARADWAGRFWYSFYEKGAVMTDFCREALAYMTSTPVKTIAKRPIAEVKMELLALLHARPWLLILDGLERVLVAYHRIDAATMADEEADIPTDKVLNRNPCDAIRDEDNDLLRALAACAPSKILISSRLIPRVLLNAGGLPIPQVQPLNLPGMDDADAEEFLRANGVTGTSHAIRYYLKTYCDNHPLTIGALAGLIRNYLPKRGDFDRWAADPQHGAALDLASLDLKQRRNHILTAAIAALSEPSRALLSTLALIQEGVDYETLAAFNPHPPGETQRLAATVRDLLQRGLLQYDDRSERYDLHPVVRGVASGALQGPDKETQGQKVIDFFNSRPHSPYREAQTMEDVASGLHVVRTLIKLERWQQAADAYWGDLARALLYNLEAHNETLALLQPFFPAGWDTLPETVDASDAGYLANDAASALYSLGKSDAALGAHSAALKSTLAAEAWSAAMSGLHNISANLTDQNRLAAMLRVTHLSLDFAIACEDAEEKYTTRLAVYFAQSQVGQWQDAVANWQAVAAMKPPSSRATYREGDAELLFAQAQFWQGRLEEAHLTAAATLAEKDNNRTTLRYLHWLRGEWHLQRGEHALAAASFQEALRMARERRLTDGNSETALALCKYHLGQLADPAAEAEHLAQQGHSSRLLAELYAALGDAAQARHHALAAYRLAWADGEPYVRRYELTQATALLTRLGEPIPALPAYDASKDEPFPWEAEIREIIQRIKKEKAAAQDEQ